MVGKPLCEGKVYKPPRKTNTSNNKKNYNAFERVVYAMEGEEVREATKKPTEAKKEAEKKIEIIITPEEKPEIILEPGKEIRFKSLEELLEVGIP